jgi:hypothetical protein
MKWTDFVLYLTVSLSAIFLTMACGKVSDQTVLPPLDHKALDTAEKIYCQEGQRLVEDRTALNVTFDKLAEKSHIFAFSNGVGECALQNDIDHIWPSEKDPMSFHLRIHHACLPNNSIWVAQDFSLKTERKYIFQKVADTDWPALEMTGTNNLAGSYVAGLTGLKVLVCQ